MDTHISREDGIPLAALVVFVCGNDVNLSVFDAFGLPHAVLSVPFVDPGEGDPEKQYCEFPQYQPTDTGGTDEAG